MRMSSACLNAYLYQHLTAYTPYLNAFTYPYTNPAFLPSPAARERTIVQASRFLHAAPAPDGVR